MNDDQVKGKAKDIAGRVERQVGEWTGDKEAEVKGAAKQVEGKVQNAWGNVKDAARDAKRDVEREADKENRDIEDDRERGVA